MFTCISCRIAFETAEEQRSHFGTDWHRYNMKRRVANLPPIAAVAFNEKVIERREQNAVRPDPKDMACSACKKEFSTENAYRSHVQSKKHREREAAVARAPAAPALASEDQVATSSRVATGEATLEVEEDGASEDQDQDEEVDDDDEDEEQDIENAIAASRRRVGLDDCLFCAHKSADITTSIAHMSTVHSFFIPDQDLLIDMPGLIAYLGEKVAVGNLCLYCPNGGKEFGSLEAVRKHMIDKSHCKLAYETDEDRVEVADFYDFGGGEGSDWEDMDEGSDYDAESTVPSLASDGLSLVLPGGRVLGHRSLKVYYSQRLRASAPGDADPVQSKVALVRQRLADPTSALVPVAGGHGAFGRGLEVMKARNAGEAVWAQKQGRSFKDQRAREALRPRLDSAITTRNTSVTLYCNDVYDVSTKPQATGYVRKRRALRVQTAQDWGLCRRKPASFVSF